MVGYSANRPRELLRRERQGGVFSYHRRSGCSHSRQLRLSETLGVDALFQRFKAGHYGHFYGTVDPLVITEALQVFLEYRADRLARIERDRQNREAKEGGGARRAGTPGRAADRRGVERDRMAFNL